MATMQQQQQQTAPKSPFGLVTFARPENARVSTKYGRTSTAVAAFKLELPNTGLIIDAMIWANLQPLKDGSGDEIVPEVGRPKGLAFATDDDRRAYESHVDAAAASWVGFDRCYEDACTRLTTTGKSETTARKLVPRLVKRTAQKGA